jgi:hypothetical protein
MSELARFYGIIIRMYHDDHPPAHFHVQYGEHHAQMTIAERTVLNGYLPPRALGLVAEWASLHRAELMDRWHAAENLERLTRIDPLP